MVLQHYDTDGGTLAVEVEGNGPLIVCAPAMGDFRDSYAPLAAQLVTKGYTLATMDPRGCPFGAAAAVVAAGKKPELVKGEILLGAFLRNGRGVIGLWILPLMFLRPYGPWICEKYAKTLWPGLGERTAVRAAASRASLDRPGRWIGFQNTVSGLDHRQVAPWIEHVKVPVLVLMGDKDLDWSDPLKKAEWIASNFKDVKSVAVKGVGHAPMLEDPEFVGKEVIEFLEKVRNKREY